MFLSEQHTVDLLKTLQFSNKWSDCLATINMFSGALSPGSRPVTQRCHLAKHKAASICQNKIRTIMIFKAETHNLWRGLCC